MTATVQPIQERLTPPGRLAVPHDPRFRAGVADRLQDRRIRVVQLRSHALFGGRRRLRERAADGRRIDFGCFRAQAVSDADTGAGGGAFGTADGRGPDVAGCVEGCLAEATSGSDGRFDFDGTLRAGDGFDDEAADVAGVPADGEAVVGVADLGDRAEVTAGEFAQGVRPIERVVLVLGLLDRAERASDETPDDGEVAADGFGQVDQRQELTRAFDELDQPLNRFPDGAGQPREHGQNRDRAVAADPLIEAECDAEFVDGQLRVCDFLRQFAVTFEVKYSPSSTFS